MSKFDLSQVEKQGRGQGVKRDEEYYLALYGNAEEGIKGSHPFTPLPFLIPGTLERDEAAKKMQMIGVCTHTANEEVEWLGEVDEDGNVRKPSERYMVHPSGERCTQPVQRYTSDLHQAQCCSACKAKRNAAKKAARKNGC